MEKTPEIVKTPEILVEFLTTTTEVVEIAKADLVTRTVGTNEQLENLLESYNSMMIKGITDMTAYKEVESGIKELKKTIKNIDARRKELTDPAINYQKLLISEAKTLTDKIEPVIQKLSNEKSRIDDERAEAEKQKFLDRSKQLTDNGFELVGGFFCCGAIRLQADELKTIDDAGVEFYVNHGKTEIERKAAEQKRLQDEKDAIQRERDQLRAEREQMQRELAELRAEREKLNQEKNEVNAQTVALSEKYEEPQPVDEPQPIESPSREQSNPTTDEPNPTPEQLQPEQTQSNEPQPHVMDEISFNAGFEACRALCLLALDDTTLTKRGDFKAKIKSLESN